MKGNVALTTVLVLSALFVLTAVTIVFEVIDFGSSTSKYINQIYSQNTSFSCLEEAYYKISRNGYGDSIESAPSEFMLNLDDNRTCNATVYTTSGSNRIINISSDYKNSLFQMTKTIQDINADNWQIN